MGLKKSFIRAALSALLILIFLSGCSLKLVEEKAVLNTQVSERHGAYKYYFNTLSDNGKAAYNNILEEIENFPESVKVPVLSNEELERMWLALMYDNPGLMMLGRECSLNIGGDTGYFSCDYAMTQEEYSEKRAALNSALESFKAVLADLESDYEKELAIHDRVIEGCRYVSSDDLSYSSAYGVLVTGEASCEGYAKAVKLLLDEAGIENHLVCGTAMRGDGEREGHMWNIVAIGGENYHLDATWDDPISGGGEDSLRHAYFNITEEEILKTHTISAGRESCTATAENYFVKSGTSFDSYEELERRLPKLIAERGDGAEVRLNSDAEYERSIKQLFDEEEVYRLLERAALSAERPFSTTQVKYIRDDSHRIIELFTVAG